jgi:mRNA-degrading endonuclease RelE of RelBE toxin-antitoxin system
LKKSGNVSTPNADQQWKAVISPTALHKFERLPKEIAQDIIDKIDWLCNEVNIIKHSRLKGGDEFSLHSGQYRILYLLDRSQQRIDIVDIGKHDEVYKRLQKRQKS